MELQKQHWTKNDIQDFQKYLVSFKNADKAEWSQNLINTKFECLAIPTPKIKEIAKNIGKGNFTEFLDLNLNQYYENFAVNGFLIPKIKDFDLMKKYLQIYAEQVDNWANCDLLSFDITGNEEKYLALCKEFIKSPKPFVRRIGVNFLFKFLRAEKYIDQIFQILNGFENETEYYVNMVNAWLVCECFIKQRDLTLKFLQTNKLNKFTVNKAISKCRDSFRVTPEDKEMLLKFKK